VHDSDVPVSTITVPAGPEASALEAPAPEAPAPEATSDAAWLAEAYDTFAEALYGYCRSLVREPATAADAVQDTFVVTAFRLAELPEQGLLRAWLHAVARNECLRAIAGGGATPAPELLPNDSATGGDAAPGGEPGPDAAMVPGESPESSEVKALLRAALGGLDPAERDVMVMTWHGLDTADCAAVLGISPDEASKALFRGRDQLEAAAGVMTVASSGTHECGQLTDMLAGWDGRLTPALRTQLRQHIDHCDTCCEQRRTGMRPAILLRLAPDTLRGMSAGASPLTAWVISRLREQALAAAFDTEPESFERRAMVVRRSGPYRDDGFPVPLDPPGVGAARKHRSPVPLVLAGVGGTGLLAVAVIAGLALSGNHSTGALPSWTGLSQSINSPASSGTIGSASASAAGRHRASASASARPRQSTAAPTATPGSKAPKASARPSATASARPSTSKSADPSPTTSSAPLAPAPVGVSPGSLQLSPDMSGGYGGWLTLANSTGSAMSWSMSLPQGLASWGNVVSGTLAANSSSTRLYIFTTWGGRHGHQQAQTQTITLQPGNVQVTVTIP
jgi:RNA polymerase sigma factor (sigma-70 family)